jgi:hypothetical protein
MLKTFLHQACSPQGRCRVSGDALAGNHPDIGPGWKQSKQNWSLQAVVKIKRLNVNCECLPRELETAEAFSYT